MKVLVVIACLILSSEAFAQEYLGKLSENPYNADSTSNPYGEGLSIYGDDDG